MGNRARSFVLLLLAPLAAFAQTRIEKQNFSITIPVDWEIATSPDDSTPVDDSSVIIRTKMHTAMAWAQGLGNLDSYWADYYVRMTKDIYINGVTLTDSSVKNLGGKDFVTTGWKSEDPDDPNPRYRMWVHHRQDDFLFISWVSYDSEYSPTAPGDIEKALESLEIKASTTIRRPVWNRRADAARPRIDVLGRTLSPEGAVRIPAMPFFLRR